MQSVKRSLSGSEIRFKQVIMNNYLNYFGF